MLSNSCTTQQTKILIKLFGKTNETELLTNNRNEVYISVVINVQKPQIMWKNQYFITKIRIMT